MFTNKKVTSFNSDWWHLSFNVNTTLTTTVAIRIFPSISTNGSTLNAGATGTETIWGAQLEQLSHSTSYIPTNGAANTRLQDIANNSGNSTLINSTEGVLY